MWHLDLFDFFRYALAWVATVYATVITLQSLWGWYVWLTGSDKYVALVRRYLILHGLRLRVRAFGADVLVCLLLCVAFLILWYAHGRIDRLNTAVERLREPVPVWARSAEQLFSVRH